MLTDIMIKVGSNLEMRERDMGLNLVMRKWGVFLLKILMGRINSYQNR